MAQAEELRIDQRLDLLESEGVIGRTVRVATAVAVKELENRLSRSLGTSTGHILVTRLAMTVRRAETGQSLREAGEELRAELTHHQAALGATP